MITTYQALARCAATKTWAVGMCDNFCANMYGFDASGYVDATAHWASMKTAEKHPGDHNPPAGMLVFWGGGHGHIAISAGGGNVWSTDIAGAGTVAKVPLTRIGTAWGKPYLGWSLPVFQGVAWKGDAMIPGADIAGYQANSGWEKGLDFVLIKATEGASFVNSKFQAQRDTATAAKLITGFYHFARGGSMTAQADHFLDVVGRPVRTGEILAFDWEDTAVSSAEKDAWIKYTKAKSGRKVILYCNRDFWLNRDTSGYYGDGLWIADPDAPAGQPRVQAPWLIHQYSEVGALDHDVAQFANRAAMLAWAGGTTQGVTEVELGDKYTNPKGVWSPEGPETATVGQWLAMGNKKAEAAAETAKEVKTLVQNLALTEMTDAQIEALAAKLVPAVVAALPKVPTAKEIADEFYKRMQS